VFFPKKSIFTWGFL